MAEGEAARLATASAPWPTWAGRDPSSDTRSAYVLQTACCKTHLHTSRVTMMKLQPHAAIAEGPMTRYGVIASMLAPTPFWLYPARLAGIAIYSLRHWPSAAPKSTAPKSPKRSEEPHPLKCEQAYTSRSIQVTTEIVLQLRPKSCYKQPVPRNLT